MARSTAILGGLSIVLPWNLEFEADYVHEIKRGEKLMGAVIGTMDLEGFGGCTNHGACQNACPKEIGVDFIAQLNRDLLRATFSRD